MTAWQDPPLTRREARERERRAAREAAERAAGAAADEGDTQGAGAPQAAPTPQEGPDRAAEEHRPHHSHHRAEVPEGRTRPDEADAEDDLERTLPGRLDHRTRVLTHPEYYRGEVPPASGVTQPTTTPPPSSTPASPVPEHSMTRRELRAMLQAEEAAKRARASGAAGPDGDDVASGPAPVPAAGTGVVGAGAAAETKTPVTGETPRPSVATGAATSGSVPAAQVTKPETTAFPAPHSASRRRGPEFDEVIGQHHDSGGSSTASSALILPEIPKAPDATGPLTATGEVLVTGTIDLPRSLGSTGQHPDRYDSAEMDRMFDAEADPRTSDVEPVRASKAISSHTSTRGLITPPQKKGSKLTVILPVTAGVLALAVIGLVIAGFVFNVF